MAAAIARAPAAGSAAAGGGAPLRTPMPLPDMNDFDGADERLVYRTPEAFRQTLFTREFIQEEPMARLFQTWSPPDEEGHTVRPTAIARFEGPAAPECKAQAAAFAEAVPAADRRTEQQLGRPQFFIEVYEVARAPAPAKDDKGKRAAAAGKKPAGRVIVVAESAFHDSTDPAFRPPQYSREEMDNVLFTRDVRMFCEVDADVLKVTRLVHTAARRRPNPRAHASRAAVRRAPEARGD